jgi:hypothetical protein
MAYYLSVVYWGCALVVAFRDAGVVRRLLSAQRLAVLSIYGTSLSVYFHQVTFV